MKKLLLSLTLLSAISIAKFNDMRATKSNNPTYSNESATFVANLIKKVVPSMPPSILTLVQNGQLCVAVNVGDSRNYVNFINCSDAAAYINFSDIANPTTASKEVPPYAWYGSFFVLQAANGVSEWIYGGAYGRASPNYTCDQLTIEALVNSGLISQPMKTGVWTYAVNNNINNADQPCYFWCFTPDCDATNYCTLLCNTRCNPDGYCSSDLSSALEGLVSALPALPLPGPAVPLI